MACSNGGAAVAEKRMERIILIFSFFVRFWTVVLPSAVYYYSTEPASRSAQLIITVPVPRKNNFFLIYLYFRIRTVIKSHFSLVLFTRRTHHLGSFHVPVYVDRRDIQAIHLFYSRTTGVTGDNYFSPRIHTPAVIISKVSVDLYYMIFNWIQMVVVVFLEFTFY